MGHKCCSRTTGHRTTRAYVRRGWLASSAAAVVLAVALGLAGCGSSSSPQESTTAAPPVSTSAASTTTAREKVPDLDLLVSIPGLKRSTGEAMIPQRYTCDGADISPPLHWGRAPAHTVEIDLFIVELEHEVEYTQWAVAGLSPKLQGLPAGSLPLTAIQGLNHYNQLAYKLCPPNGVVADYAVLYLPLPRRLPARDGFNATSLALRAVHTAPSEGQLFFTYKRA
jgi:phosphatidylethanolamine-binding protein (PEBP) family uncharacterized protein